MKTDRERICTYKHYDGERCYGEGIWIIEYGPGPGDWECACRNHIQHLLSKWKKVTLEVYWVAPY